MDIEELDFLSVGTMDLTYACGVPGEIYNESVQRMKRELYQKIVASGKVALDKTFTAEEVEMARRDGISCFYVASDMSLIKTGAEKILKHIHKTKDLTPEERLE